MSTRRPTRTALLTALEQHMRTASAQGVLFSHAVAAKLGIAATDLECLDIIGLEDELKLLLGGVAPRAVSSKMRTGGTMRLKID